MFLIAGDIQVKTKQNCKPLKMIIHLHKLFDEMVEPFIGSREIQKNNPKKESQNSCEIITTHNTQYLPLYVFSKLPV